MKGLDSGGKVYYCISEVIQKGGDPTGWEFSGGAPIHAQLMEQITHKIISGDYAPGTKLPSVRDLASEAAVNPNTMQKALSALEGSGLVYSERTSGRYVTDDIGLIENAKEELALKNAEKFFSAMAELGYEKAEALTVASRWKEVK